MLTFLGIAISVYGAMHFYAFSKVWLAYPHSPGLYWALVVAGIIMTLSPFMLWQVATLNWHRTTMVASWVLYSWMGFLFLFCCNALALDISHLLASLLGLKWTLNNTMALLCVSFMSLALMSYGFISARQIQVEEVKISTHKRLPSTGQITIAQLSDLHLGAMLGDQFLQQVIAKLLKLKPDIIVATGDIIDGHGDDLKALAQRFHSIHAPNGLFAVTGNHEYFAGLENSLRFLREAGFTILRGESSKAGGIILLGVDDHTAGKALGKEVRLDVRQALASLSKDDFVVLLKHQPLVDMDIPFDLQLSGHVHGGQIFPFGLLTQLVYHVHTGLTQLSDGRLLYVSRGTGTWGPPLRLFAAPEITLITIMRESKSSAIK